MTKKILILEDDPYLSRAYQIILAKEGYDIQNGTNGKIGLELIKKEHFDLILLDMIMPEMTGVEFLNEFKPLNHPETKVVVFSNVSTPNSIEEAMKLGAVKYLTKATVSPRDMIDMVKEVLAAK